MNKKRNQVIPAVFLILKKQNKVLLLRRFNTGFQDDQYTFPAGHVEKDESPIQAVCREAKEEIGVQIQPDDIIFEQVLYRKSFNATKNAFDEAETERVDFFFVAKKWKGTPYIAEPDKSNDLQWFNIKTLPPNLFPIVRIFLSDYPNQKKYSELGY